MQSASRSEERGQSLLQLRLSRGDGAKVMKAQRRAPGWRGGLQRFWKALLVCCCGELEDLHTEALVVVPVSELSVRFIDFDALFFTTYTSLEVVPGFPAREDGPRFFSLEKCLAF